MTKESRVYFETNFWIDRKVKNLYFFKKERKRDELRFSTAASIH